MTLLLTLQSVRFPATARWPLAVVSRRVATVRSGMLGAALLLAPAVLSQNAHDDTLATVGNTAITTREYAEAYAQKLLTVGLTDNNETREQFLANLVDDEVLIAMARDGKLDRTPDAQAELARIKLQTLLENYVARHIRNDVAVSDSDLRELYARLNTRLKVRHLYSPNRSGADSLVRALAEGKSFEELALKVFADPVLRFNGGCLGYVTVDDMDPAFERAAYAMKIGETSGPVRTARGYSVMRVDDIRSNPLLTETEFLEAKERLQRFVRLRKFNEAVRRATDSLRVDLRIRIDRLLTGRLLAVIQRRQVVHQPEDSRDALSPSDLGKSIVTSSRGAWSVRDLIESLSAMPERQKNWIRTEEDLEDVIAGLVMQREVARVAVQEGLDRDAAYQNAVRHEFDGYLLRTLEEQLRSRLVFSRDTSKAFYLSHRLNYMSPPEIRLSLILLDDAVMADSVLGMLRQGAAFADLAQRYSLQRSTADRGGDAGYFPKPALGEFGGRLFALASGEWTGPLEFEGRHLFARCTERRRGHLRPFDEVEGDVRQALVTGGWFDARRDAVASFKKRIAWSISPEKLLHMPLSFPN